jgi:hypothetical protein
MSGIRTHHPSVEASEDSSCLRLRGHSDRRSVIITRNVKIRAMSLCGLLKEYIKLHGVECYDEKLEQIG